MPLPVRSGFFARLLGVSMLSIAPAAGAAQLIGDLPRANDRPLESLPGLDTEYAELRTADGARRSPVPVLLGEFDWSKAATPRR